MIRADDSQLTTTVHNNNMTQAPNATALRPGGLFKYHCRHSDCGLIVTGWRFGII